MFKLLLASLLFFAAAQAEQAQPLLSVNGEAVLYKPADQLNISIAVVTEGKDAELALKDNSAKMQSVISALHNLGLSQEEYATGRFDITPTYTQQPKHLPADWRQTINGYRVTNSLNVKTEKLQKAGEIIDAANKAGANSIDSIYFTLKDARKYRREAIEAAVKNATADAGSLASAAGLKLGRILKIALDDADAPGPIAKMNLRGASFDMATPIEAGDVPVHATVAIVFEID